MRVEVTLDQAIKLKEAGFVVTCFIEATPPVGRKKRHHARKNIPKDTKVTLSLDGEEPRAGRTAAAWAKVKKKIWGKNAAAVITYERFRAEIVDAGGDANSTSQFLRRYGVIREVQDGTDRK